MEITMVRTINGRTRIKMNGLSLEEAKELARNQVKMTHVYFSKNEYMTMRGNRIIFEDGANMFIDDWIGNKTYLNDGWSKFKTED